MASDRRPDYGIDAPGLVRAFLGTALVGLSLTVMAANVLTGWQPWTGLLIGALGLVSVYAGAMGGLMIYWSRFTKVRERETMLDAVAWRGDEHVLDIGCGRGLLLVAAARRLSSGRAVGIDIWQSADQSANAPEHTRANARIEGVGDRVEVQTADMRALPFADAAFDVVLSHWVVHNLAAEADRDLALAEMARVLRPGGAIILADIANRDAYAARLTALGLTSQQRIVPPLRDAVLTAVSFGSFRPATIVARAP